ncbi:hypothetical protein Hanom_Chr11g01009961 [Helianthus anomalus]
MKSSTSGDFYVCFCFLCISGLFVGIFDVFDEPMMKSLLLDITSAADWRYAAKQFVKRLSDKVIVHCSDCNYATLTFDGVDRMGEILAEEVFATFFNQRSFNLHLNRSICAIF